MVENSVINQDLEKKVLNDVNFRKNAFKKLPPEMKDPTHALLEEATYVMGAYLGGCNVYRVPKPKDFMKDHEPDRAFDYMNIACACINFLKEFDEKCPGKLEEYSDMDKYDFRNISNIKSGIASLCGAENIIKLPNCDTKDNFEQLFKVMHAVLLIYETENAEKIKITHNYKQDLNKLLKKTKK
ncbi:hypothetical protein HYT92_00295 [Candidatus Pacearchaeota archaeon]|nr:hypothetical protein [Candidatus Pacearchaeota archaeon]